MIDILKLKIKGKENLYNQTIMSKQFQEIFFSI